MALEAIRLSTHRHYRQLVVNLLEPDIEVRG